MEAIVKVSEELPRNFDSYKRLAELYSKARASYMRKYTEQERQTVEDNFWNLNDFFYISFRLLPWWNTYEIWMDCD